MKVTDLRRKLAAALLAAGVFIPSTAVYAQAIPLGDSSFEDFATVPLPAGAGYAYAEDFTQDPPSNLFIAGYRPESDWVDDPDSPGGYIQDDLDSNWLYDSSYDTGRRPAPRTGINAMHGGGNYNGQETAALFEADKTYQFSVYAQGDSDADGATSRVWLYIYDGSVPFSEADSLNFARYAPDAGDFVNRTPGSTQAQSQANWTQISLFHRVAPGAPEIGQPVGVAFWGAGDAGIDDATLNVSDFLPALDLSIDRTDGSLLLSNNTGGPVNISGYQLTSAFEGLDPAGWVSIADNYDADSGGSEVDGTNVWTELTQAGAHGDLSEADLESGSGGALAHNQSISLGNAGTWIRNPNEDLIFEYIANGKIVTGFVAFAGAAPFETGDVDTDGDIDEIDWGIVRSNQHTDLSGESLAEAYRRGDLTGDRLNNYSDFVAFKAAFDGANGLGAFEVMLASVPEPSTILLLMTGGLFVLPAARRSTGRE